MLKGLFWRVKALFSMVGIGIFMFFIGQDATDKALKELVKKIIKNLRSTGEEWKI